MQKKPEPKPDYEVYLHSTFKLAQYENVQRIAMSLAQASFFVRVKSDGVFYELSVYSVSPSL